MFQPSTKNNDLTFHKLKVCSRISYDVDIATKNSSVMIVEDTVNRNVSDLHHIENVSIDCIETEAETTQSINDPIKQNIEKKLTPVKFHMF